MLDHVAEPLCPELELEPVCLEVDALDQQLDDAGLLGGEELLPRTQWVGWIDVAGRAPAAAAFN